MNAPGILQQLSLYFPGLVGECQMNLTRHEMKLVKHLKIILETAIDDIEMEEQLDLANTEDDVIYCSEEELCEMNNIQRTSKYTLEQMKDIVNLKYARHWKFSTIKHKYKNLADEKEIWRYKKYINNGGTHFQKWLQLSHNVYQKFKKSREFLLPVHDSDLKRWGLQCAREADLPDFTASDSWILNFKTRYNISSRRITKFVTKKLFVSQQEIEDRSVSFTLECSDIFAGYERKNIINFDQSGFNYEVTVPRTLSFVGERKTFCLNMCSTAITHSFTVLPCLLSSGEFLPKCLLVLQESSDNFGPLVRHEVADMEKQFPNLRILASKSGKMSAIHMQVFKDDILRKYITEPSLIMHDAWRGQTECDFFHDCLTFVE
jgi:hypothetical protein